MDWLYMYTNVENIGDINDDGWNDVMLIYDANDFSYISYIYCYPGMDTLVDGVFDDGDFYRQLYQGPMCCFGFDHSWAGDIDGDGIDDALISARETNVYDWDHGWIVIQGGWHEPVAVDAEPDIQIPNQLKLNQNYPNPFNSGTVIEFTITRSSYTELRVFNILGELVATPLKGHLAAGDHRVIWDGCDNNHRPVATGMYFYQIKTSDITQTKKMVLLK